MVKTSASPFSLPESMQSPHTNINSKNSSDHTNTIKMLCQCCSTLEIPIYGEFRHHASYTDLLKSAEAGCELCSLVRNEAMRVSSEPDKQAHQPTWLDWDTGTGSCKWKQGEEPGDNFEIATLLFCTAAGRAVSTPVLLSTH